MIVPCLVSELRSGNRKVELGPLRGEPGAGVEGRGGGGKALNESYPQISFITKTGLQTSGENVL